MSKWQVVCRQMYASDIVVDVFDKEEDALDLRDKLMTADYTDPFEIFTVNEVEDECS